MLTRRATLDVVSHELTCCQCGDRLVHGRKIVMLQVSDDEIEPCCIRCLVQIILEATEVILVLPDPVLVYKGRPRPR